MDISTAQAHLDQWLAADLAVANGQSYSVAGRSLTRADASTIRGQIAYWQRVLDNLNATAAGRKGDGHAVATWT